MNTFIMYLMIIIVSLIITKLMKNKYKALKLLGIITITTSIATIIMIFIASIILKTKITLFNVSVITDYLLKEYGKNSLYFSLIGVIELILSKYLHKRQNKNYS